MSACDPALVGVTRPTLALSASSGLGAAEALPLDIPAAGDGGLGAAVGSP